MGPWFFCLLLDLLPLVTGSRILSSDGKMKQEIDRWFWCGISCTAVYRAEPESFQFSSRSAFQPLTFGHERRTTGRT